ncbi:MAG: hypothetical protein CEE38_06100 [Planctomycetes bacterium B3_Pla]|nr:MAG: hypothetical protein CEE38_06100 [Planctomycetes bacterium B3_Pla]
MKAPKENPVELLKRAAKLGITPSDYYKFRILFAKGFDAKVYASLKSSIGFREFRQSLNPSLFNTPEQMHGDIVLGKNDGDVSRYDSKYAPSHLLGIGATGVGKTVFLVFLLLQYLPIASGLWIFDFVKRELRGIKRLASKINHEAIVCRHENLRINLLDPQGSEPSLYANICAEFITLSLGLPPVAKLILKICITNLYEKFRLFTNPDTEPPILSELIDEVKQFDGNKAAKDAILIRLQALLVNKRQIFSIRRGFRVSELAKRIIAWEFDGLETQYQNLFVSYLLSILFAHRVTNPSKDLVVVALDEASRLYSRKAEAANEGPSYIATMTSVIRRMYIALFVWTQTCHDLSNSIIANSGIKIMCRVGSGADYDTFGRAMGLTSQQIQWCKTNLGIGTQVIKMGFGWMEPFLNHSPNIRIPDNVTDAEVRQSVQQLLDMVPKPGKPTLLLTKSTSQGTNSKKDNKDNSGLTADEKSLLDQIRNNPQVPSATIHYKMAGLSTKRATVAKQALLSKKLINETPLESGKRGAANIFLEVVTNTSAGRLGNSLHNYLRRKAEEWYLAENCKTESEKSFLVNGQRKFVDLAVTWPDGREEAVEIETDDSIRALENIRKNLDAGFGLISVLTPNRKVREVIRKRVNMEIDRSEHHRIRFPAISFYDQ